MQYERFCFLKHYSERQVRTENARAKFEKYGHEVIKRKNNLTEVFKPLRWKQESEEFQILDEQF